jgi:hypothetical protein
MASNPIMNTNVPNLAVPYKMATETKYNVSRGHVPGMSSSYQAEVGWDWANVNGDWKKVSYSAAGADEKAHSPDIFEKLDEKTTALNDGKDYQYQISSNKAGYFDRYVHANDGREFMLAYGGKNSWYDPISSHISSGLRLSFNDNGELKLTQMKYPSSKSRQEALGDIFTQLDSEDANKTVVLNDKDTLKSFLSDIKTGSASNYAVLDTFKQFAGNYIENLAFKILENDVNADKHRDKITTFLHDLKEQGYSLEDIRDIANKTLSGLKDDGYKDLGQGGLAKLNLVLRDKELSTASKKPFNIDKIDTLLSQIKTDSGDKSSYGPSVQSEKSHKDFVEAFKYGLEKIGITGIDDLDNKVKKLLLPSNGTLNLNPSNEMIRKFLGKLAQEMQNPTVASTSRPAEKTLTAINTPWAKNASEILSNPKTNDHKYLAKMILESQAKIKEFFEMFPNITAEKKNDYVLKILNSKPEDKALLDKIGISKAKEILGLIGF